MRFWAGTEGQRPRTRRACIVLLATSWVSVLGCDRDPAPTPASAAPQQSAATQQSAAPAPPPVAAVPPAPSGLPHDPALPFVLPLSRPNRAEVKLESAGSGTLHELRYALAAGAPQAFSIQMNIEPTLRVAGKRMPGSAAMQFDVTGTLTLGAPVESRSRRSAHFDRFVPTSQGLGSEDLARLQAQFGALEGLILTDSWGARGDQTNAEVVLPVAPTPEAAAFLQTLGDSMSNAFLPLPAEAVGQGARWTSEEKIVAEGVEATQTSTFVLIRMAGSVLSLRVEVSQAAPSQRMLTEHLPPGVTVELVRLSGTGQGMLVIDLAKLSVDSSLTMNLLVETRVTRPGSKPPIPSSTSTAMKLKTRVAARHAAK